MALIPELQKLLDLHSLYLRDHLTVLEFQRNIEITTPYLNRHNDYIQVYVYRDLPEYCISDGAYTLVDLYASACDIRSPSHVERIETIARALDVQLDG